MEESRPPVFQLVNACRNGFAEDSPDPIRMLILLVEDDPGIADVLEFSLKNEGHSVVRTTSGREALSKVAGIEVVILDIGLPDMDGFDVCREIRKTSNVPVIFLTARSEEIDRVVGLELGADDYLTKPFSARELHARIKAVVRRLRPLETSKASGLELDRTMFTARLNGRELSLSKTEFDLLECLSRRPGQVLTRSQILDQAWPDGGCVTDRTVDAHIKSLRKKLLPGDLIETIRGVGYRFRGEVP